MSGRPVLGPSTGGGSSASLVRMPSLSRWGSKMLLTDMMRPAASTAAAPSAVTTAAGAEATDTTTGAAASTAAAAASAKATVWDLTASYLSTDAEDIKQFLANHVEYTLARSRSNFDAFAAYQAAAYSVRDRLIEFWNDTQELFAAGDVKEVCYLSIEFLVGRSLRNAITNLQLRGAYTQAVASLGYALEDLYEEEQDAALGNGGLGRLAACFLDSMATMDYPGWGYGIRYTYGMFRQDIHQGQQAETPDFWLSRGNPWEIERNDVRYTVRFGGAVRASGGGNGDGDGPLRFTWEGGDVVWAVAYDTPVPGYGTLNTLTLRLWSSRPANELNLDSFNRGDYYGAIEEKQKTENITSVLYPNDTTAEGKALRLKQQYFFASASLQDMIKRFKARGAGPGGRPLSALPTKLAIQLNDTHPVVAIAELMRILLDDELLGWDEAWQIVGGVFAYTNHTVLPEALESWALPLFEQLLPRHLQIVYEINARFLALVQQRWPGDVERLRRMSIIEEGSPKRVRMAYLAVVAAHTVNGVAAIHSDILCRTLFRDFVELWPHKFQNKTNGVTPRRWLVEANPELTALIEAELAAASAAPPTAAGSWMTDLAQLQQLRPLADDAAFQQRFMAAKRARKAALRDVIAQRTGGAVVADVEALFDIQVKRIHEYKRQLLNILGVIERYQRIKALPPSQRTAAAVVPRVVIFGGKAAPGYQRAKLIIQLINAVARVINDDAEVGALLKVVFLANYNVSLAEVITPASDISQHISTAGTEASGTSNMKFAMNGGLILGTLDGANIEIRQHIGEDNMFIFGALADQVDALRHPTAPAPIDARLARVLSSIEEGQFGSAADFAGLVAPLRSGTDYYLIAADFASYLEAQARVDAAWRDTAGWVRRCIHSTCGTGWFSSDRTINEYAADIWHLERHRLPQLQEGTAVNKGLSTSALGTSQP